MRRFEKRVPAYSAGESGLPPFAPSASMDQREELLALGRGRTRGGEGEGSGEQESSSSSNTRSTTATTTSSSTTATTPSSAAAAAALPARSTRAPLGGEERNDPLLQTHFARQRHLVQRPSLAPPPHRPRLRVTVHVPL
eukprot:3096662-Rhodomonas_salina.1